MKSPISVSVAGPPEAVTMSVHICHSVGSSMMSVHHTVPLFVKSSGAFATGYPFGIKGAHAAPFQYSHATTVGGTDGGKVNASPNP